MLLERVELHDYIPQALEPLFLLDHPILLRNQRGLKSFISLQHYSSSLQEPVGDGDVAHASNAQVIAPTIDK